MSIRIVYPNPFTGLAAFAGGATEAYNAGRINSQNQQAAAEYQAAQQQAAQDYQLYSQVGGALSNLGTAAIFAPILAQSINPQQYANPAPTALASGRQIIDSNVAGAGSVLARGPENAAARAFASDIADAAINPQAAFAPDAAVANTAGVPANIARGVVAANVLENVLPGTSQLGQIPLQQYVSNQNAARNFQYDQAAADAGLVRRQQFFDYTRAAQNEDDYMRAYGVTPAQTQQIGQGIYNNSSPMLQSSIARQFGYDSPSAISSLPRTEQDQFYGAIGLKSVRMQRAQEAIANDISARQQEALVKNAAELQSAYEQGQIELSPPYEQQYRQEVLEPEADLRRAIVNGDIDGYDAEVPLHELASRKNRFWATIPPKAYQKDTKPQDIANQMVVEHPKKKGTYGTLKIGRNGQREIQWDKPEAKTLEFRSPKERDAHYELHTKRDADGNVTATFNPKDGSWKPVSSKPKESAVEPPKIGDIMKMRQDYAESVFKAVDDANSVLTDPSQAKPYPSQEEIQSGFEAMLQGSMKAWQGVAIGTDQFGYMRSDIDSATKAKREDQARSVAQAQMLRQLILNSPPEVLQQFGIDRGRFTSPQPPGPQQPPPSQPTIGDVETEMEQIRSQYPNLGSVPPEVRARVIELKTMRERLKNAGGQ